MKVNHLRKEHPVFYYHSFESKLIKNNLHLSFLFQTEPDIFFRPKVVIENVTQQQIKALGPAFDNFVFHLGLAEIPSYWKATCSPKIVIKAGYLAQEQIKFWQKLILRGLGQFFYVNRIDFTKDNFVEMTSSPDVTSGLSVFSCPDIHRGAKIKISPSLPSYPSSPSYLLPLGGGKDSIVTLEILKEGGFITNVCTTNPTKAVLKIIKIAGFTKPIVIRRGIDSGLIQLNKKGYLNGHVPITAYFSFLSLLLAALFDYNNIAFANERSADEENLTWLGKKINHQYSKSLEFENDFRTYSQKYLAPKINYFSFLRPLYELQISRLFAHFPKYFPIFKSCNRGEKTNSWCCSCPKCLSVFLHLSPFLPLLPAEGSGAEHGRIGRVEQPDPKAGSTLLTIFGKNLFTQKSLLPTFAQLLGQQGHKPFECVGTLKENRVALYLALKKWPLPQPPLLEYGQKVLQKYPKIEKESQEILAGWNNKNNLPGNLGEILSKRLNLAKHKVQP